MDLDIIVKRFGKCGFVSRQKDYVNLIEELTKIIDAYKLLTAVFIALEFFVVDNNEFVEPYLFLERRVDNSDGTRASTSWPRI